MNKRYTPELGAAISEALDNFYRIRDLLYFVENAFGNAQTDEETAMSTLAEAARRVASEAANALDRASIAASVKEGN